MERVGLIPSDTGAEGGRRTGVRVSHYIQPDGAFAHACADLVARGIDITFVDRWATQAAKAGVESPPNRKEQARRLSKATSKTRFSCPVCEANAWGKPNLRIDCRPCGQPMIAS